MTRYFCALAIAAAMVAVPAESAFAANAQLLIESWRNDDLSIWQDKILPVFEKEHPDIQVTFAPTQSQKFNAVLNAKLSAGTAGDIITCRPFDASEELYNKKQILALNGLPGLENFSAFAKAPFSTDDGKTTFCVPMASVIHGFIYNKDIFDQLGLTPPHTVDQFFAVLDKIKQDGQYVPLVIGTADQGDVNTQGYQNIGPTYWKGEKGRLGIVNGTEKFTDPDWVEPFKVLARWAQYMGDGFQARAYPDSQNLFMLGRGAIYPSGSWDIATFTNQGVPFQMGAFPPPVVHDGDPCYINDHPDIGMGINSTTKYPDAAKTFLTWVASPEFASLYTNALPGFFTLSNADVKLENPLAQQFVDWRKTCEKTFRPTYQYVGRGEPNIENEMVVVSANVVNGIQTPEQAATQLQKDISGWYGPQKKNQVAN